jgi:hypothetical protein
MFIRSFPTQVPKIPTTNPTPKLLKEILSYNNIGLNNMASDIDQTALDYLLTSQQGEVPVVPHKAVAEVSKIGNL